VTTLFARFIQHGIYLRNWSAKTIESYQMVIQAMGMERPTKSDLEGWVIGMRQRGLTPGGVNLRIRTVNSYCAWLHSEGEIPAPVRLKLLRRTVEPLTLLSPSDVQAVLRFRPKSKQQRRTWTLVLLLLDTGLRIREALSLERSKVNLEAMTLVVMGKGRKERVVTFFELMRRILFLWMRQQEGRYVFGTRTGTLLGYHHAYRGYLKGLRQGWSPLQGPSPSDAPCFCRQLHEAGREHLQTQ
jgi:site-specific recombinase XerD